MLACRYCGSVTSPYWIRPATRPSTSTVNGVASGLSPSGQSSASSWPHQRWTSGVYRIRRSWSTSLSETGRSRTAAPRSSVTSGSVCQAGAVIVGVGIDVVDVARFAETIERTPAMLERVFTPEERQRPLASQAARFAAKEALAKALGAPQDLQWHDAEVVTTEDGRPWFEVRGSVAKRCEHLGVETVHLSLSHDAGIASAVVVLEGTP